VHLPAYWRENTVATMSYAILWMTFDPGIGHLLREQSVANLGKRLIRERLQKRATVRALA